MKSPWLAFAIVFTLSPFLPAQDKAEKLFSGPQVGEKTASLKVFGVYDKLAGKTLDLVKQADGKPLVVIFVHKLTRPGIGMSRPVMNYAVKRAKEVKGMVNALVFLTDDRTALDTRLKRIRRALPSGATVAIAPGGLDGPGAYGLNRKVTLTIIVAKGSKVTANYALVQPSLQSDALSIVKSIAAVTGGKVPKLAELIPRRRRGAGMRRLNRQQAKRLNGLVLQLISEDTKAEDLPKTVARIEQLVRRLRQPGRIHLAAQAKRAQSIDRFKSLPQNVQAKLNTWAKFKVRRPSAKEQALSQQLRPYLAALIARGASNNAILLAAERLEKFVAKKPDLQRQLGVICNRIKNLRYGTPFAQEIIKAYAKRYGDKKARPKAQKK